MISLALSLRNNPQTTHIALSTISFVIFSVIIRISGFSLWDLINVQNTIIKTIFLQTNGMNTIESVGVLIHPFLAPILAFIFLVLGLASLSSYGYYKNYRKVGAISSVLGSISVILLFNLSILSLFIAVGLIISSLYIIPLANAYSKEFKKWVLFRTGSNSIRKALLIFNIILALGIFLTVFINLSMYSTNFRQEMTNDVSSIAISSIPGYQQMNDQMKQAITSQIENSINNSSIFNTYVRWLPLTSAVGVWIVIEFLTGLIFSNIGGLFTKAFIRISKNIR